MHASRAHFRMFSGRALAVAGTAAATVAVFWWRRRKTTTATDGVLDGSLLKLFVPPIVDVVYRWWTNPFNKGVECFYIGDSHGTPSDDNRTLYREKGVVTGIMHHGEYTMVMVQFPNNKVPVAIPNAEISRTKPDEEFSDDRYRVGVEVEWTAEDYTWEESCSAIKGWRGVVVGPVPAAYGAWRHANQVCVMFAGNGDNASCPITNIRRLESNAEAAAKTEWQTEEEKESH